MEKCDYYKEKLEECMKNWYSNKNYEITNCLFLLELIKKCNLNKK